jgi:hypothetical protein
MDFLESEATYNAMIVSKKTFPIVLKHTQQYLHDVSNATAFFLTTLRKNTYLSKRYDCIVFTECAVDSGAQAIETYTY